ncbi:MAG: FKBP-type peptidyl-prolyl cis-trans isomerase [Bacteroidales bacterium]|nr:FKBP-type peptidyl-prolyl cis-trans isomerase [Bacteroidales bacterium]
MRKRTAYEGALNVEKGNAFRKDFYEKNSADSTASGIVYLIQDSGSEVRATSDRDTVKVNYRGTLIDGKEFDKNEGISFPLNRVIRGWTEGMKLVGEGGKVTLVIPANLAYGERGPRNIGTNSTLIFDVELLEVHPYVEKPAAEPAKPAKRK